MKIIANILYIEYNDAVDSGINCRTVMRLKSINDIDDSRKMLIEFETLPQKYKQKIIDRFGNPYIYVGYTLIKQCLNSDLNTLKKVTEFKTSLRNHVLPNGTRLPEELYKGSHTKRGIYVEACVLLHWLSLLNARKAKKIGFDSLTSVYESASNYVDAETLDLPQSYSRLRMKIREFKENGYLAVINKKYGNDNGKKVGKGNLQQYQESLLITLLQQHNNFDFEQVRKLYNQEAKLKGFKIIQSKNTVLNFFRNNISEIMKDKKGKDITSMQNRRSKPSTPFYYLTQDVWEVELPYQETRVIKTGKKKGQTETTYHKRLKLSVALDPFNDYPAGFSVGKSENAAMTVDCFKNAIDHVAKITGEYYRPWQIQTDNFLSKKLRGFFTSICQYYTPAAVGNPKSKVVERYFNKLNKEYCQFYPNWSGFNLNSTNKNQPNTSAQNDFKKHYPTESEVRDIIVSIINQERQKKQAEWLENFKDGNKLDRIEYLEIFGLKKAETNRIHDAVFSPTIDHKTLVYDTFDEEFKAKYVKDWTTYYDPSNLESILVTADDGRYKFLLERKYIQPMALRDRSDEDSQRLQDVYNYNTYINELIEQRKEEHTKIINKVFENENENEVSDAHTIIKQSFVIKGQHKRSQEHATSVAKMEKKRVQEANKTAKKTVKKAESDRAAYLREKQLPNILD